MFRAKSFNTKHIHESSMQPDSADPASMESHAAVADDQFTHLSTFGLSGRDGSVQWHHVVGDFERSHAEVLNSSNCLCIV